jgi:Fe-S oxidoreductase
MYYDHFVLPFAIGLLFLFCYIIVQFGIWIFSLNTSDRKKFFKGVFSYRLFAAFWEMLVESLFHRKMFRVNRLLGYMHMSFAFGWFMLIVMGNVETRILSGSHMNPPYYPIFFKFFHQQPLAWEYASAFSFLMDLLLLYVLTGFVLAVYKRIRKRAFGMKKTTRQRPVDRIALTSLWLIFPLRLLAESFTSGLYHNGSFMTAPLGEFFSTFLPLEYLMMPAWWAYSLSLGVFFVMVPFTRYMHIPAELLLIMYRRFGLNPTKKYDSFTKVEVHSCPRCGVCIDKCQISSAAGIHNIQPLYLMGDIRHKNPQDEIVLNCSLCGRCQQFCPVGIHTENVRLTRRVLSRDDGRRNYEYITMAKPVQNDVIYFAGCMTHLTPSIKIAMKKLFEAASVKYNFIDEDGSICCGRPLMMAGEAASAAALMEKNISMFIASGAKTLVTSCPICYKVFTEDYKLPLEVLHHTQYLNRLVKQGLLNPVKNGHSLVYHDPCDLGRGSNVYAEPRELLSATATLIEPEHSSNHSLCCGGALGNFQLNYDTREMITNDALAVLLKDHPDHLITACPLCKKTFAKSSEEEVLDVAEWLVRSLPQEKIGV